MSQAISLETLKKDFYKYHTKDEAIDQLLSIIDYLLKEIKTLEDEQQRQKYTESLRYARDNSTQGGPFPLI